MRIARICAVLLAASPALALAQESAQWAGTCAICHGTSGHSVGVTESLAGTPKDELLRKMKEFRDGARPSTIMGQIAKGYSDAQLEQMAAYFAAQKK